MLRHVKGEGTGLTIGGRGCILEAMKVLTPILLIVGTLYSVYMAIWYGWQAAYWSSAGELRGTMFCEYWWRAFCGGVVLSVVGWILYGMVLWRGRGHGWLVSGYVGLGILLYVGTLLCIKAFFAGKM